MTLIWLIVWLCYGTPSVQPWNPWFVGLAVCAFMSLADAVLKRRSS